MADAPSSLMLRLRTETRPEHEALEQHPLTQRLPTPAVTAADVRRFLEKLYGFRAPIEARLAAHGFGPEWELAARLRLPHLRADLTALGAAVDALPLSDELPPLRTEADLLGAWYVLEGSSLGGQVIGRALAGAGLPPSTYFTGAGPETGAMWRRFGQLLTAAAVTPAAQDAVVEAARHTFSALSRWINRA